MSEKDDEAELTATPAPAEPNGPAATDTDTDTDTDTEAIAAAAVGKSGGKTAWVGAAVGIGSAAIVAALLYANKRKG